MKKKLYTTEEAAEILKMSKLTLLDLLIKISLVDCLSKVETHIFVDDKFSGASRRCSTEHIANIKAILESKILRRFYVS